MKQINTIKGLENVKEYYYIQKNIEQSLNKVKIAKIEVIE